MATKLATIVRRALRKDARRRFGECDTFTRPFRQRYEPAPSHDKHIGVVVCTHGKFSPDCKTCTPTAEFRRTRMKWIFGVEKPW